MRELNGFWLFVSSCLPGCGQMYQGYMKRGFSLLVLFWATVGVTSILQIEALGVVITAIWLYAYFDSYNLHTLCKEGRAKPDTYLFGGRDGDLFAGFKGKGNKVLGWVLVGIGAYALLEVFAEMFESMYGWSALSNAMDGIVPKIILIALIIWLGVWFIRGPKQKAGNTDSFESYSPASGNSESSGEPRPEPAQETQPKEDEHHE